MALVHKQNSLTHITHYWLNTSQHPNGFPSPNFTNKNSSINLFNLLTHNNLFINRNNKKKLNYLKKLLLFKRFREIRIRRKWNKGLRIRRKRLKRQLRIRKRVKKRRLRRKGPLKLGMLGWLIFKLTKTWRSKEFGLALNYRSLNSEILLIPMLGNQFGRRYIHNKMVSLKLQSQENIGSNFIIWVNRLKYKLTIEYQWIKICNKCFLYHKNTTRNGH